MVLKAERQRPAEDPDGRRTATPYPRVLTAPGHRVGKYLVLAAVAVILVLTAPLGGKIGEVEDNGPTSQLPRDADSTRVEDLLPGFDTSGILPAVVVYERTGGLTQADLAAIEGRWKALAGYAAHDAVSEVTPSADGEAATITLGVNSLENSSFDSVGDIRDTAAAGLPSGLEVHVTGAMASFYDSVQVFDGINTTILLASAGVVALLLLLTYRSPVMWLLPLVSIGVAMTLSQALIYLLAKHADLPVDGQSGGILPILVFGVGTDYALLLVARYREELHHHVDRHRAMTLALRRATPAIAASAATVVLGLSCLMLADINSTRSLGAVCAIGVACAAVAVLTVLPMTLTILGRWVFWPLTPRVDTTDDTSVHSSHAWRAVAARIEQAPRPVWILIAVALVSMTLPVAVLNVGTPADKAYRDVPDSVTGQTVLGKHFPAGESAPTHVIAPESSATEVRTTIASAPGVDRVAEGRVANGMVLFAVVLDAVPDSPDAEATVTSLRTALADQPDALVGGTTARTLDTATAATDDRVLVMGAVFAVVLLVLLVLLRAVVAPLVLLGTVVLSYLAALGLGGLLMRGLGYDSIDVALPLLAFVFLVTLGVDYTIFLVSRVREEVARHGARAGMGRGLVVTGGVITSAGLILAATFAVLITMPSAGMIGLGVIVALGILLDTFVVRSLLVPALAVDLGTGFWFPRRDIRP